MLGEQVKRRLAAVVAVDIAEYGGTVGADKDGRLERLKVHLRELINPKIHEYDGGPMPAASDDLLVEFPNIRDAVRWACDIQHAMLERERDIAEEQRIRFRIGIDVGDIVFTGDTFFGDSIDAAIQLKLLAEPGGLCLSRSAHDQVCDELPYGFADLGEQRVRNLHHPVDTNSPRAEAADASPGLAKLFVNTFPSPCAAGPRQLSIVVLPFANLSDNLGQQYFAHGITEDVTADLSRLHNLLVISRATAFTYRDKPIDAAQVGRELNVRYVLTGGVRRVGNRVGVNVRLIDAERGPTIWADDFECQAFDILELQDEVVGRISNELDIQIASSEATRSVLDPDAFDYLLKGCAAINRGATRRNVADALELFNTAVAIDPAYGQAKALLAEVLVGRVLNQLSDSTAVDLERAQALAVDAQFSSAHASFVHFIKGQILRSQCRYEEAISEYETAVALDRNDVKASAALGQCRFLTGAMDEAIPAQMRALRLSPRDPKTANWLWRIGMVYLLRSQIDKAILWLERAQSTNPQLPGPQAWLAAAYGLKTDTRQAGILLTQARRLSSDRRYSSVAEFVRSQAWAWSPRTYALAQTTLFEGLRRAGMSEA